MTRSPNLRVSTWLFTRILGHVANIYTPPATSTAEEWNETGRNLFQRRLFTQAASCFEKASRPQDRDICLAYQQREDARAMLTLSPKARQMRRALFHKAGLAFRDCALVAIREADIRKSHKVAGECFLESEDFGEAARSYREAHEFTTSASLFRKAGMFDEAVALVKPPGGADSLVERSVRDRIIDVAKLQFLRTHNLKSV